jgi:hypothetical protein
MSSVDNRRPLQLQLKKENCRMRKVLLFLSLLIAPCAMFGAPPAASSGWQSKVEQDMPRLGHRNWILVVDSAYPLQSSPGVETLETNADQLDVIKFVLGAIDKSVHVRPYIFIDAVFPYVQEEDAPGTSAYRDAIAKLLDGQNIASDLHEKLIADVDDAGRLVNVLILKTRSVIPYSSVFIRLNCKYWGDDAEERLRAKMPAPVETGTPAAAPVPPVPQPTPEQSAPPPPAQPGAPQTEEPNGQPTPPPNPQ